MVFGEIEDESLALPNNEYTRAFNLQLGGLVFSEADFRAGHLWRLYIKDILVDDVTVINGGENGSV